MAKKKSNRFVHQENEHLQAVIQRMKMFAAQGVRQYEEALKEIERLTAENKNIKSKCVDFILHTDYDAYTSRINAREDIEKDLNDFLNNDFLNK